MFDSSRTRRIRPSILPYVMAVFALSSVVPIFLTVNPAWATTPVITAPATASGTEGSPIAPITATATDADAADILTITRTGEPASLTFTHTSGVSPRTARISGTLVPGDAAGSPYNIEWNVNDGAGGSASTTTVLTVTSTNHPPIGNPGGPYQPVCPKADACFDGGGSSDPDPLQTLTYSWDFGDGTPPATGQKVCHSFEKCGSYNVCLTVTDNGSPALSNTACTTRKIEISSPQLTVSRKSSAVVNLKAPKEDKEEVITVTYASPCPLLSDGIGSWMMRYGASVKVPDSVTGSGSSATLTFLNSTLGSLFSSLAPGKTTNVMVTIEGTTTNSQCTVDGNLTLDVQK